MTCLRRAVVVIACVAVLCAACSSSSKTPASAPTAAGTSATTLATTLASAASTTTATTASTAASTGGGESAAGGSAALTISGALSATLQQVAGQTGCANEAAASGTRSFVDLNFTAADGGKYRLQVTFFADGTSTTLPIKAGDPSAGARISFWQTVSGDYLTWGYDSAVSGQTATGTVTPAADAKSGSLDVQLLFTGDVNKQIPAAAKPPVEVKGTWRCG
jgi:hypothetical protein